MFPVLTDAQIGRAELHATRRSLAARETTFELGTADPGIHTVLSGALEVVRPWAAGLLGNALTLRAILGCEPRTPRAYFEDLAQSAKGSRHVGG
jgi:hypothetical protein